MQLDSLGFQVIVMLSFLQVIVLYCWHVPAAALVPSTQVSRDAAVSLWWADWYRFSLPAWSTVSQVWESWYEGKQPHGLGQCSDHRQWDQHAAPLEQRDHRDPVTGSPGCDPGDDQLSRPVILRLSAGWLAQNLYNRWPDTSQHHHVTRLRKEAELHWKKSRCVKTITDIIQNHSTSISKNS